MDKLIREGGNARKSSLFSASVKLGIVWALGESIKAGNTFFTREHRQLY